MIKKFTLLLTFLLQLSLTFAATYYVAPNGSDANNGTIDKPFATVQKAQSVASPGDIVYLRGGTYHMQPEQISKKERQWAYVTYLDKSGAEGKPIKYWAYPNEKPVFDLSAIKPDGLRVTVFYVSGSWIHLKGIEVIGTQVTIKTHTQSECFENQGSNNIYELLSMHDGMAIGFYLLNGSNNLVLNCDAYRNWDYYSETGRGGNTDGFGCHPRPGAVNNVFKGCRAWFNSDDGYDVINSAESVTFDHCWAMYNGLGTDFKSLGDGNGFKAGGFARRPANEIPNPVPRHTVQFCLAVGNKASGFYANHHINGDNWYNNTAYKNSINFNMLNRLLDDPNVDVPGYNQKMRNNLGYKGRSELQNLDKAKSDVANNYFDLNLDATDADFVSLNEALLTGPRKADGSLPDVDFMKLKPGSRFIDKGADIGFPFKGAAPDLGCFELGAKYNY
ncbi:rhamnogalacturonan lyase domain-containing protein [Mucilaginibacter sp. AW1-3]